MDAHKEKYFVMMEAVLFIKIIAQHKNVQDIYHTNVKMDSALMI